jgi:protein O-GlcNAc transferase
LRAHASLWRNFVGLPHGVVEKQIREDAPDVLVDLAGHTGFNRLPVFAQRVAPVQISYLGYPNTTGLAAMDYRFVDAVSDPTGEDQRFHTERLFRFAPTAWAYEPPVSAPEVSPAPCTRGGPIAFGSFNNFAKVSAATVELWARVLEAVPDSRLVLKGHGLHLAEVSPTIARRLEKLAVDPARVQLLGRTPNLASHLSVYAEVDVALDTVPYNGTTTTCEALWMGVPVVTLRGDRHAARVSASLLTAAGHPEWIASSKDEYVHIATTLAKDPARLSALRTTLRNDLRQSALLDHAAQAKRFGDAIFTCCENRTQGL